eukprot:gb/GFBE01032242.1/.p1 GENE.gb/GFBE01032242.1/~~gb/GFBE01032242.1/.p1  ORF type:complete len:311 (+),score=58.87 gb/GFBE01032242.1/:1-933(+)
MPFGRKKHIYKTASTAPALAKSGEAWKDDEPDQNEVPVGKKKSILQRAGTMVRTVSGSMSKRFSIRSSSREVSSTRKSKRATLVNWISAGFRKSGTRAQNDLSVSTTLDAVELARVHGIPVHEVRGIAQKVEATQKQLDPKSEILSMDHFYHFMCSVFDVDMVDKAFVAAAYKGFEKSADFTLANFIDWYKVHMFSDVAPRLLDSETAQSEKMIYELATKHKVSPAQLDKIKMEFNRADCDKSGLIEYEEFEQLTLDLWKAHKEDVPRSRLEKSWRETDIDRNGTVDFSEFVAWYLKYHQLEEMPSNLLE